MSAPGRAQQLGAALSIVDRESNLMESGGRIYRLTTRCLACRQATFAHGHEKVLTGGQFESSVFGQINDITFPLTIHHLGPPVGDGVGANQHHTNRGDTTIEVSEGTYGRDRRLSRSWKLSGCSSSL